MDALGKLQEDIRAFAQEKGEAWVVVKLNDGEGALVKNMEFPCPPNEVVKFDIYMPNGESQVVSIYVSPEAISRIELWDHRPPGISSMGPMGFDTGSDQ